MLFAAAALTGAAACNKLPKQGEVDLTPVEKPVPDVTVKFSHPGAYVNAADLARVKQHVAAADANDPVFASWKELCASPWAQENIAPSALETVVRGDPTGTGTTENYILCCQQAGAAFQLALRWQISGDAKYAEAARAVWDADVMAIRSPMRPSSCGAIPAGPLPSRPRSGSG